MHESRTTVQSYCIVRMPQGQFSGGYTTLTAALTEANRLNGTVQAPAGRPPYYAVLPQLQEQQAGGHSLGIGTISHKSTDFRKIPIV